MKNKVKEYSYDKEIEMMLTHFVPRLLKAETKEEADEQIFWIGYMLKYVVEKYYTPKGEDHS